MAAFQSINPFPADIDRDRFGGWLSGFADGEACFVLAMVKGYRGIEKECPSADFRIALRADDRPALVFIQSYLGCGWVGLHSRKLKTSPRQSPAMEFNVSRPADLALCVVPHFERHPMYAKKRLDYEIWKQGVLLAYDVSRRRKERATHCGRVAGFLPRWTAEERARFRALCDALRAQRVYQAPTVELPPVVTVKERGLFDPPD